MTMPAVLAASCIPWPKATSRGRDRLRQPEPTSDTHGLPVAENPQDRRHHQIAADQADDQQRPTWDDDLVHDLGPAHLRRRRARTAEATDQGVTREDGRPRAQVSRFQPMAPSSAGSTDREPHHTRRAAMISLPTVCATRAPKNAEKVGARGQGDRNPRGQGPSRGRTWRWRSRCRGIRWWLRKRAKARRTRPGQSTAVRRPVNAMLSTTWATRSKYRWPA